MDWLTIIGSFLHYKLHIAIGYTLNFQTVIYHLDNNLGHIYASEFIFQYVYIS